jgi:hypothetical protein
MKTTSVWILTLPAFDKTKPQLGYPSNASIAAQRTVLDARGVAVTYRVRVGHGGGIWWVSASIKGVRHSATLHTTSPTRGAWWIAAVTEGKVQVVGESCRCRAGR